MTSNESGLYLPTLQSGIEGGGIKWRGWKKSESTYAGEGVEKVPR